MIVQIALAALVVGLFGQGTFAESCEYIPLGEGNTTKWIDCENGCCGNDKKNITCCQEKKSEKGLSVGVIVTISIVGYVLLMVIVSVIIKCCLNKDNKSRQRIKPQDENGVQYLGNSSENTTTDNNTVNNNNEPVPYLNVTPYPRSDDCHEPYMFKEESKERLSHSVELHRLENYVVT